MLKVKTVYDYRQELCDVLRSGKYRLSNRCGYKGGGSHCAIGAAIEELAGDERVTALDIVHSKLGITPQQRYEIERMNDLASDEDRVATVCAYIEALP